MPVVDDERLDATFAALANGTRRAILAHLARSPATVNELAEPFALTLPAVSKHLNSGVFRPMRAHGAFTRRAVLSQSALQMVQITKSEYPTFAIDGRGSRINAPKHIRLTPATGYGATTSAQRARHPGRQQRNGRPTFGADSRQ